MVFSIDDVDYSKNVITGSYKVNQKDIYDSYTDANGKEHRDIYRTKVSGNFNMFFRTAAEYKNFVTRTYEAKQTGGYYPCKIAVNNTGKIVNRNLFMEFEPTRDRDGALRDTYDVIAVTVEEA